MLGQMTWKGVRLAMYYFLFLLSLSFGSVVQDTIEFDFFEFCRFQSLVTDWSRTGLNKRIRYIAPLLLSWCPHRRKPLFFVSSIIISQVLATLLSES